ncbi:TRM11 family SAM-dependent methyltransferase [Paenibacillus silvae]|nr:RNA methyltransferase [Paenibacillus silvae]
MLEVPVFLFSGQIRAVSKLYAVVTQPDFGYNDYLSLVLLKEQDGYKGWEKRGMMANNLNKAEVYPASSAAIERIEEGQTKEPQHLHYLYIFACHENELPLCEMELSALLQTDLRINSAGSSYVWSERCILPGRSPFIHGRLDVLGQGDAVAELLPVAREIRLNPDETFKVVCLKAGHAVPDYDQARKLERDIGMCIRGTAQMKKPKVTFGLIKTGQKWLLGQWTESDKSWQVHQQKPQNYSTGFGVALARALVNIAVPVVEEQRLLDPCCGMGTVVIEALSMGIDARGNDLNALAVRGARVNLPHFGYDAQRITLGDMKELEGRYDSAIFDMPYNLCSVLPDHEQRAMLMKLRELCGRAVIISTEWVQESILEAGWTIERYGTVRKSAFVRHIWVCS